MRVRPIFWVLLVLVCTGVLGIAYVVPITAPAVLQVHVDPRTLKPGLGYLHVQFTDEQGMPITNAKIVSQARMTNMQMSAQTHLLQMSAQGDYLVGVGFSMSGPWSVTIQAHADGFASLQKTIFLQVVDETT